MRRTCSRADGTRYSMKRKNDLMAARRTLRVDAPLPRFRSRSLRNSSTSGASICGLRLGR